MPRHPESPILLIDDDPSWTRSLSSRLTTVAGFNNFLTCHRGEQAGYLLKSHDVSLVLLDLTMPPPGGAEILKEITLNHPRVPVIVVSGIDDLKMVVEVIRQGAFDYFVKGHDEALLVASMHKALKLRNLELDSKSSRNAFSALVSNILKYSIIHSVTQRRSEEFSVTLRR